MDLGASSPENQGSQGSRGRFFGPAFALLGALPTVVHAALNPGLLLDDIEFAQKAQFRGWEAFYPEMAQRPGQGLIHALQFIYLGERATVHLIVVAIVTALASWLFWHVTRLLMPHSLAVTATVVFLLLPNRSALRFWASTVPNNVAFVLFLAAALVAARDVTHRRDSGERAPSGGVWVISTVLGVLSVLTYEAAAALVILVPAGLAITSKTVAGRYVAPLVSASILSVAALAALVLSPRPERSVLWGPPLNAFEKHFSSLAPTPLNIIVLAVFLTGAVWSFATLLRQRGGDARVALIGCTAALAVAAGLAPFIVGGFNIQTQGVLDRAHLFPGVGSAVVIAVGIDRIRTVINASLLRPVLAGLAMVMLAAVFVDLGPYLRSAEDQREALASFTTLEDPAALSVEEIRVVRPSLAGGVAWGHNAAQARSLYQLAKDDPVRPEWLSFFVDTSEAADAPPAIAFFEIEDGQYVQVESE